jgi:transcriptional regulator with XRE-family HTH domain
MASSDHAGLAKALRRKRGLSQEPLAREIGFSADTLNSWVRRRPGALPYLVRPVEESARDGGVDPEESTNRLD